MDQKTGFILDVDLEYPERLHSLHRENPLAPYTTVIGYDNLSGTSKEMLHETNGRKSYKATKMVTTFEPRKNYVIHYMNLQL